MMRKPHVWSVALICWLAAPLAAAGSYSVHPVVVELSSASPATTLNVRNRDQKPVTLQLAVKQWAQPNGEDELNETRDIIAVPPTFTIAPGGSQIVRVGLRSAHGRDEEQAYRLLLQEIPATSTAGQGLQLALNMSLPLFVQPAQSGTARLEWSARKVDDQTLMLSVANRGSSHFKFTSWRVMNDERDLGAGAKLRYVLAGARQEWRLQPESLPDIGDTLDIVVISERNEQRARALVQ
ncbi:molecular chaperone [Litorivivens sp.]|uniref:fimbrial biogenesis chaperone n=2 Tax=Litorivivens sp. TaxID=2020868 RepID=UPI003561A0C7